MGDLELIRKNGWLPQIVGFYGDEFHFQTRGLLAKFLAQHERILSWNPQDHHRYILEFVTTLKAELGLLLDCLPRQEIHDDLYHEGLSMQYQRIQAQDPIQFFQIMCSSLQREKEMIWQLQYGPENSPENFENMVATVIQTMPAQQTFQQLSRDIKDTLANISIRSGQLCTKLVDLERSSQALQFQMAREQQSQEDVAATSYQLKTGIRSIEVQIKKIIERLNGVLVKISTGLAEFMDEQRQLTLGKGKDADLNLNHFENWFKNLAQCLATLEPYFAKYSQFADHLPGHIFSRRDALFPATWPQDQINNLREAMIAKSLIIEKQPTQVIRTGVNFGTAAIQLRVLPWCTGDIEIVSDDAVLVNNETAHQLYQWHNHDGDLPVGPLELTEGKKATGDDAGPGNIIEYNKMIVGTKKDEKRMKQFVAQKQFWIYFRVKVQWQGGIKTLWALSLPIWVTSHPSQDPKAWSQVIWYNAFPATNRSGLDVPEIIQWDWLVGAIDLLFVKLGKGLSGDQKAYLKEAIFRGLPLDMLAVGGIVAKARFCSEPFPFLENGEVPISSSKISFGEWIYLCWRILSGEPSGTKSSAKKMSEFWAQGKILGFLSKQKIENKLRNAPRGTFIIRFPENRPNYIGLYFYSPEATDTDDDTHRLLKHVFSTEHFDKEPFEDSILESPMAKYLYSNYEVQKHRGHVVKTTDAFEPTRSTFLGKFFLGKGYFKTVDRPTYPSNLVNKFLGIRGGTEPELPSNEPIPSGSGLQSPFQHQPN